MKVLARNRRANFDYDIERTLIAGLVLSGAEAKSLRNGLVSLKGSFVHVKDHELWLINAHITPYPHAAPLPSYEPTQARKLLVSKHQLDEIQAAKQEGRSVVPIVLLNGRYLKIEIGIGKGKRHYDKRQTIKKRDTERNIARNLGKQI